MRRIKLTVAYDGTDYCGWQIQPNGITVESALNNALSRLTGEPIKVIGASRTDAGVHAPGECGCVRHGKFDTSGPDRVCGKRGFSRMMLSLCSQKKCRLTGIPGDQDVAKTYEYRILNRRMRILCAGGIRGLSHSRLMWNG